MFNQILPIFALALLGVVLRRFHFLTQDTVEGLKKLVVNLALPSVLFLSFLRLELQLNYISLSAVIFAICLGLFVLARIVHQYVAPDHPYFPFVAAGFEYGMLGVGLFAGVYGIENIQYIAVIDLGHEIFIWFVMLPFLLIKKEGQGNLSGLARTFITNPVILAIVTGITLNALGLSGVVQNSLFSGGIVKSLEFLSQLTVPLILLIIGFGIELNFDRFGDVVKIIAYRYIIIIPIIYFTSHYIIDGMLKLDEHFQTALFTLFILPSPFIIPLFMGSGYDDERKFINNILAIQTVLSIIIFSAYLMI